jgi:hypothetical protein
MGGDVELPEEQSVIDVVSARSASAAKSLFDKATPFLN